MLKLIRNVALVLLLGAGAVEAQFDFEVTETFQGRAYRVGDRVVAGVRQVGRVQEVTIRLRDALGRIVDARVFEAKPDRRRVVVEFPLQAFSTHRMYVDARVGDVTRTKDLWVSHPTDLWMTFQPILQVGPLEQEQAWYRGLRALGVRTLVTNRHEDALTALDNGMFVLPANITAPLSLSLDEKLWATYLAAWSEKLKAGQPYRPARRPSYHAQTTLEGIRSLVTKRAFADSFPLGYILATDLSYTRRIRMIDFDYSAAALQAYRGWLAGRYETVGAPNRAWGSDFRRFDDVMPLTTDQLRTREQEARTKKRDHLLNYRPLSDNLAFADESVLNVFVAARTALQQTDRRGMLGCPSIVLPAPFGGHDIWKLTGEMSLFMPPEVGCAGPMIESFLAQRGLRRPLISRLTAIDERTEARLWSRLIHGDRGLLVSPDVPLVTAEGKPTEQGEALAGMLDTIHSGMGYFMAANTFDRVAPRVALYHSRPSLKINWLLDTYRMDGPWRAQRIAQYLATSTYLQNMQAWAGVLDRLGVAYHYVAGDRLLEDPLPRDQFDVLVLPRTLAMSDTEIERVEQFAKAGGIVIADSGTGLYNEHLQQRDRLPFDRLLGLEHKKRILLEAAASLKPLEGHTVRKERVPYNRPPFDLLEDIDPSGFKVVEPAMAVRRGATRPLAVSVSGSTRVPMLMVRRLGRGVIVYLNLSMIEAAKGPSVAGLDDPLPPLVLKMLALGGVKPESSVRLADGGVPPAIEQIRYRKRDAGMLIVNGRPGAELDLETIRAFGQKDLVVTLPREGHVYSVLEGKHLGRSRQVTTTFGYRRPLVLVSLPYEVKALKVDRLSVDRYVLEFDILIETESGVAASEAHVVDLRVVDPKGNELPLYHSNIPVSGGRARSGLVMSRSDTQLEGEWTLRLRDLFSGKQVEATFELKK
ncbi:MAG: hypothetical protein ACOCXX_01930 [Planctomycetota bacterium]